MHNIDIGPVTTRALVLKKKKHLYVSQSIIRVTTQIEIS